MAHAFEHATGFGKKLPLDVEGGRQPVESQFDYFFNPACQLSTTVMGTLADCSTADRIRNRPSLLTSKLALLFPSRTSNDLDRHHLVISASEVRC